MHAQDASPSTTAEMRRERRISRLAAPWVGAPWLSAPRIGTPWVGALALAALLTGASAGGSTWLALAETDARARGQAARSLDEALDLMRIAELAAGLSADAAELEAAGTAQRQLTAHNALRQRTHRLASTLEALPRDWRAELRFAALAIRAEADELNATVERRLAVQRSLQDLIEQVADRSEALAEALATLRTSSPDDETMRRIDGSRQTVALRLLATGTVSASAASARAEFRKATGALFDALNDLPIDAASPRRADAARQLVALGMDEQNVFDLRQEREALTAKAAGIATLLRGTASDLAQRAGRGALALRDGLRDGLDAPNTPRAGAELSTAAPAGVGLLTGLAVFAVGLGVAQARARRTAQPDPDKTERTGATNEGSSLRVLLAEDEPVSQQAAAALLRRAGHEVTVVGDGRAALAAVEREPYDLVLMDVQMPDMDGIEATRRIRALSDGAGNTAGLRIVALTASAVPGAAERCRAAGADAVLEKPLRLSALDALLDHRSSGTGVASALADMPPPPDGEPGLPVFDEDAIRQMREHLPAERVATLVTNTLVTLRGYHAALEQAWNADDRATAGAMAHKIAGVAGIYGCMALRGAAQALERALDTGEGDPDALCRALDDAVPPALAALDRWSDGG
ncbi:MULTISPECIES: response regulator [Azospirillum]|uniref:Response regulator n=1 Tax=Azospirillum brasilense TaxID=192 RepID=A0ABU4P9P0_AZOBR|nr:MULTISPECIES: response regulator [Azospirillum]MDW7554036.1 response regulator [Azospirillum brasilense]MDW7592997.1 response regulator [Azospirillum brasilense]MDW7593705.1 response regulator [Azospirillum brasilense]MDW7627052.1 response regulator [Azospirillum brasilense]MDX5953244.1 response regulator [Azospirillum brasilense]